MVNINKIINDDIKILVDKLIKEGATVFLVGGAIRDYFYNIKVNDFDLEVYNISFEKLKELFSEEKIYANEKFQTIKFKNIEISLPRIETKVGINYLDYELNFNNINPSQAILRRDFTINTLMYNFKENKLEDYLNAYEDIKNKKLVYVNEETFSDDSIRCLRLLKYHSKLGLNIDKKTYQKAKEMAKYLKFQPNDLIIKLFKEIIRFNYLNIDYFLDILSNFFIIPSFNKPIYIKNRLLALKTLKEKISDHDYYLLFIALLFNNSNEYISKEEIDNSISDFMEYQPFLVAKKKDVKFIIDLLSDYPLIENQVINNLNKDKTKNYYQNKLNLLLLFAQCDYASKTNDFENEGLKRINWFKENIINYY